MVTENKDVYLLEVNPRRSGSIISYLPFGINMYEILARSYLFNENIWIKDLNSKKTIIYSKVIDFQRYSVNSLEEDTHSNKTINKQIIDILEDYNNICIGENRNHNQMEIISKMIVKLQIQKDRPSMLLQFRLIKIISNAWKKRREIGPNIIREVRN